MSVTGTFKTQYLLTTSALPLGAGSVTPASAYYDAGSAVSVLATPGAGYQLAYWSGACSGSGACAVLMNAPQSVAGNFVLTP